MTEAVTQWLESGEYLPKFMRDFHDQKDVFKAVHELVERSREKHPGERRLENLTWIDAHVYTVDIFLWFMARRGYTLQKSRTQLPFRDIGADLAAHSDARRASMVALFKDIVPATPTPPDSTPVTTAQSPADAPGHEARPTSLSE